MLIRILAATCGVAIAPCHTVAADDQTQNPSDDDAIEEIVVYARARSLIGQAWSASEGEVGYDDIQLPPRLRVGELVEAVPGMVATQHSGTGKANQYFIRGFNLDHGTDFAVSTDGVPLNLRSHGHGQGYLDLNFLIPELVAITHYRRGPYSARVGDHSSAASVDFEFYDRLDDSLISLSGGDYGFLRALVAGSFDAGTGSITGAVDTTAYDGPWELSEDLRQHRFYGSYGSDLGGARARLTLQGYEGEWVATDQIPRRAVRSGLISPLGAIDSDPGGRTSRYALTGSLDNGSWALSAYAVAYDFRLFSNFTYNLDDPKNGDEFEQRDKRTIYGIALTGETETLREDHGISLQWGADVRFDDIDTVGLYDTVGRIRKNTVREDSVKEMSLSAWGQAEIPLTHELRGVVGLRADYFAWDVTARRDANSGEGDDSLLSPKASVAWKFTDRAEAYLSWGRGFHSNDVRGATIAIDPRTGADVDPVDTLVESEGSEIGLRAEVGKNFNGTLTMFRLELDSELVYVGDAGTTDSNGATERLGVEGNLFWQASDWLAVNASYARTHSRFKTDGRCDCRVPGAIESTFTVGVNAAWESGFRASTRLRWLGEAPFVEDNSVRSADSLLINAGLAYRDRRAEYRLDVFNLFDSNDHDIAYFYGSRLPGEPAAGVEDVHFHPLEPRSIRASVTWHWD